MRLGVRRIRMCGRLGMSTVLICAVALSRGNAQDAAKQPTAIAFARDVWPILDARCIGCHGPQKQKGGVRLDKRESAMEGGDSGKIIVPGNACRRMVRRSPTIKSPRCARGSMAARSGRAARSLLIRRRRTGHFSLVGGRRCRR